MAALTPGRLLAAAALMALASAAVPFRLAAQQVVSRFAGSVEKGVYTTDYDALLYSTEITRDAEPERIEGALVSRVYVKPEGKSNLEVYRSYERELTAAGFEILVAQTPDPELKWMIWKIYRAPYTDLQSRDYRDTEDRVMTSDLARIASFADHYILARGTQGDETYHVAVILSNEDDLYMVEELRTEAMETGTVTLDIEAMRSALETAGKIAIYDIHFATGSADIEASSADALSVIASYLEESGDTYYVVGHTDDTGTLAGNLELSNARAAAVKTALVSEYGIAQDRLETRGVGPLAPVSANADEAGRALNRRVEIVKRLGG